MLNGRFNSSALWDRGLARSESCRAIVLAVAVAVTWKCRYILRNYLWTFSLGFGVQMGGTFIVGLYTFGTNILSIVVWLGKPF